MACTMWSALLEYLRFLLPSVDKRYITLLKATDARYYVYPHFSMFSTHFVDKGVQSAFVEGNCSSSSHSSVVGRNAAAF